MIRIRTNFRATMQNLASSKHTENVENCKVFKENDNDDDDDNDNNDNV